MTTALKRLHQHGAFHQFKNSPEPSLISLLTLSLPPELDLPAVRLLLLGHGMSLLPETVALVACHHYGDLFMWPDAQQFSDSTRYAAAVAGAFRERVRLDGGWQSDPMANLALYAEWLERKPGCRINVRRAMVWDCRAVCATGAFGQLA